MHALGRILVATGVALCVVGGAMTMPFIALPSPTGPFAVGTLTAFVGDRIPVQLWYPADADAAARRASYRPETDDRTIRERFVFPLVRPTARVDLRPVAGPHAVVVYIPGWGGRRSDNTALCEDLASHGFVVAAIDDQKPRPDMDFSTGAAFENTLRWANTKVRIQSLAVSHVLTGLAHVAPSDAAYPITRTLDFGRIAAIGFSFGGATAAEAAIDDRRIRAAVNLDGWTFGETAQHGLRKPFMIVSTGAATVDPPPSGVSQPMQLSGYEAQLDLVNGKQILAGFVRNGGYFVSVDGTQHESFCDTGVLPLRVRPVPGSIDGRRAQRIVVAYVNEFLQFALDGHAAPLLTRGIGGRGGTSRSSLDRAVDVTVWLAPAAARRTSG